MAVMIFRWRLCDRLQNSMRADTPTNGPVATGGGALGLAPRSQGLATLEEAPRAAGPQQQQRAGHENGRIGTEHDAPE